MRWPPKLGARPTSDGTHFAVWAPDAGRLDVVIGDRSYPLRPTQGGLFEGEVSGAVAGDLYRYLLDGKGPFPDPASRFQPHGVHGPSEIVDPAGFRWTDETWRNIPPSELALYELHIGAFTREGTFDAAREKLPYLKDLGITAVQLMPIADFPGNRNWGYDPAAPFAPARCYGAPDDLRRFVNEAHRLGLAVHLDVVYNHLGPDGAYAAAFSKRFFSQKHRNPWGAGINLDGPQSEGVRSFFIENALHWIHEYHLDGLRLDATHSFVDDSGRHFLAELSDAVKNSSRNAVIIAEDLRNLAGIVKPTRQGGWGMDAVWADDFHHQLRRCLTGDDDGCYRDFSGTPTDIATTARQGWFFTGQYATHYKRNRGTDPGGLPPERFVFCIQNHDQVGNRALGERIHHQIDPAAYRAAVTLLLLLPQTPLLFMGQEWAASTPFQFFTDHDDKLGAQIAQGRLRELSSFAAYSDPETRREIPSPQDMRTFTTSKLDWRESSHGEHARVLRLFQRLFALRRQLPKEDFSIEAIDQRYLKLRRGPWLALVLLGGDDGSVCFAGSEGLGWHTEFHTEQPDFSDAPQPPRLDLNSLTATFQRPGAVLMRRDATI